MRRESRMKKKEFKSMNDKIMMYGGIGLTVLAVILFALLIYSKKLNDDVRDSTMSLEQMANIAGNSIQNTESASTQIGKNIEESKNEIEQNETNNTNVNTQNADSVNNTNSLNTSNIISNKNSSNVSNTKKTNTSINELKTNANNETKIENKKELKFEKPVEGDIVREYAKDNLIYSETLKEWVTHMGIDIKAEKTTVVKSAEEGTVKSIKNDPRYGLTIVIDHDDNYQTVYSNLLTSEFVVEGEKVEKGQSIGTVGNTAVFEIADESHLHFEILKDSIAVDPSIYIK